MTFLKLEQFMKILYPDSISGYPDIRILYPDIRILYPKLVCFGYHFLENFPIAVTAGNMNTHNAVKGELIGAGGEFMPAG